MSTKKFEEYQQAQEAKWDSIATYLLQVDPQSIGYLTKLGKAVCSIEGKVPNLDPTARICPSGSGDQATPPPPNWKP